MLGTALLMMIVGLNFLGVPLVPEAHEHHFFRRFLKTRRLNFFYLTLIGASTFFIPCAFTVTVELLALQAATPEQAALMMLAFVLGTAPVLLLLSFTGRIFSARPNLKHTLNYLLGFLIIAFGFFTLNTQLAEFGLPHLDFLVHHH
jgi:sulfite exporter TauE/SafE